MKLSKRDQIIKYIRSKGKIPTSKKEIVDKFDDYYHNGSHYIGQILSRAVESGYLKIEKRGYYLFDSTTKKKLSTDNKDQKTIF